MMTSLSSNPSRHRFSQTIEPWAKSEDTKSNINRELSSKMEMINANVVPPINKKLDFDILDGYDEENEGHAKSHNVAETQSKLTKSRSSDGIIRKRIDFGSSEDDVHDRDPSPIRHLEFDSDSEDDSESATQQKREAIISSAFKSRVASPTVTSQNRKSASESCICIRSSPHIAMQCGDYKEPCYSYNPNLDCKIAPSPHRTRSGRTYTSGDSPSAFNEYCPTCKPQTFPLDCHQMPSESMSSLKLLPAKRPFRDNNIEQHVTFAEHACSSDNIHLNLLQNDLVNEIAAKRPKRHSSDNDENSKIYEGRNNCMSDSSNNVPPEAIHPQFELPPPTLEAPPPLEYVKRPVSRLSLIREKMHQKKKEEQLRIQTDIHFQRSNEGTPECHALHRFRTPSFESHEAFPSPGYIYQTPTNQHSPPTNEVKAMRIYDSNSPKGYRVPVCDTAPKFRFPFDNIEDAQEESSNGHQRRKSAPGGVENSNDESRISKIDRFRSEQSRKRQKRVANINPFTPTPTFDSIKRRKVNGMSFM